MESAQVLVAADGRRIEVPEQAFGSALRDRTPVALRHRLHENPLLTLAAIADLADFLPRPSVICDTANQPLLVPSGGPPRGTEARPGDVIRHLDERSSWLTLLNIEQHPAYRTLMDEHLDDLAPLVERSRGDMRHRVGFIFVSSPRSVTPAHFDIEHSVLMQVSGRKTVTVGRFASPGIEQHERERYWEGSHGRIEELPPVLEVFEMTPGVGVYLPPVRPHWVHNSDAVTVSVTLTFFTRATERDQHIEAFNARLRRLRMHPRPPGHSTAVDSAKASIMRTWSLRHRLSRKTTASASHY